MSLGREDGGPGGGPLHQPGHRGQGGLRGGEPAGGGPGHLGHGEQDMPILH